MLNKGRYIDCVKGKWAYQMTEGEHQGEKRIAHWSTYSHIIRSILRGGEKSVSTRGYIRKPHTAMNNPRSALIVLLLRDPHVLEGRQAGEDGPSNPDTVLSFGRGGYAHFHAARREVGELFGHAVGDAGVHGRSTGEDDVAIPREKVSKDWTERSEGEEARTGRGEYQCRRR